MKQHIVYTVLVGKKSCLVKYAQGPAYETRLFSGSFADPGEAGQEFKKAVQGQHEHLTQGAFDRKVESLSFRYQQELARLADWNSGKKVRV